MVKEIRQIAERAGQEILRVYREVGFAVHSKPDESPLTQADLVANEIIVGGIQSISSDPVVSEESSPEKVQVSDRFWLVDPLDGTRDFVARLDTFVVSIGFVQNGFPVLGVIHAPATGETWWAEKGQGAFNSIGTRVMHSHRRVNLIAAGSRSMPSEKMQLFYDHFSIQEVHRYGSALKFCRLAEGVVDLYPRFGPTSEWDTAAGQIIAEEAGCKVLDISTGERLKYGKPRFLNSGGFMASRADLDFIGPLRARGQLKKS